MPAEIVLLSELTVLFVVDRPVDSELTPVDSELAVVDVDVESEVTAWFVASSCEPLIASVLVALTRPAATFVICRSAPGAPTLTTLVGVVPA
nr:hypothetical protein [Burkholderia sp. BE17]